LVLNNDFQGGGTYFMNENKVLNPKQEGSFISFRGDKLQHGGEVVMSGVRYIMAVFLYYDDNGEEYESIEEKGDVNGPATTVEGKKRKHWETSKESSFSFGFTV
jgi:hypothetical protein